MGDAGNPQRNDPTVKPAPGKRLIKEADVPKTEMADQSSVVVRLKRLKTIPVFPVRYALGDDGSRTPNIDGSKIVDPLCPSEAGGRVNRTTRIPPASESPFKLEDCDSDLPNRPAKTFTCGPNAHYTLRRLRDGYLYLLSEKDNGWRIFRIGDTQALEPLGTYYDPELSQGPWIDPLIDPINTPTSAGVLLIPEEVTHWLAFSDVPWTEKTLKWVQRLDEKKRARHMRKFLSTEWTNEKHAAPISEAGRWLADAARGCCPNAFWFSRDAFRPMKSNQLTAGLDPAKAAKGVLLALEDPAGIAMDLSTLMDGRIMAFEQSPDPNCPGNRTTEWARATFDSINNIQSMVYQRAEYDVYNKWRLKTNRESYTAFTMDEFLDHIEQWQTAAYFDVNKNAQRDKNASDRYIREVDEGIKGDLQSLEKTYWNGYAPHYSERDRQIWKEATAAREKAYAEKIVMPLAELFVAWVDSNRFLAYFNGSFDSGAIESGILFTWIFNRVFAGAQNKKPVFDYLVECAKKDFTPDNLVGRAMVVNHKKTIKEIRDSIALHGKPLDEQMHFNWEKQTKSFQSLFIKIGKDVPKVARSVTDTLLKSASSGTSAAWIDHLLNVESGKHLDKVAGWYATITGPLARVGVISFTERRIFNSLAAMSIVSDLPAIPVEIQSDAKTAYFQKMLELCKDWAKDHGGQELSKNQRRALEVSYRLLLRRIAAFEKGTPVKTKAFINIQALQKLRDTPISDKKLQNLRKGIADTSEIEKAFQTEEELREVSIYNWKFRSAGARANSLPGMFRIAQGVFQVVDVLMKASEIKSNSSFTSKESLAFFGAACSLLGNIGEGIEKAVSNASKFATSGLTYGKVFKAFSFANTTGVQVSFGSARAIGQTLKAYGVKWAGRTFTTVGGVLTAYLDWQAGEKMDAEGYQDWAWAYRASAFAGGGATAATCIGWFLTTTVAVKLIGIVLLKIGVQASATVVAGYGAVLASITVSICVILLILIALILMFKPDEFEKWLDRCTWGTKELVNRFNKQHDEHQAYLKLVGV